MSILEHLQRTFRLADAADIALVSLFFYAFFMWFRSTASRQILIGIALLSIVYLLVRAFDHYMTAAIFQAGLAFAAIAAIVSWSSAGVAALIPFVLAVPLAALGGRVGAKKKVKP